MPAPSYRTPVVKQLASHSIHAAGADHTTDTGEFVPTLNNVKAYKG